VITFRIGIAIPCSPYHARSSPTKLQYSRIAVQVGDRLQEFIGNVLR
jgi:hypothetical protein